MPSVVFELTIPSAKRRETYALDRTATGIGYRLYRSTKLKIQTKLLVDQAALSFVFWRPWVRVWAAEALTCLLSWGCSDPARYSALLRPQPVSFACFKIYCSLFHLTVYCRCYWECRERRQQFYHKYFWVWRVIPTCYRCRNCWAWSHSMIHTRTHTHTHTHTHTWTRNRTVAEAPTCRRHKRFTSVPPAEFKPGNQQVRDRRPAQ